MNLRLLFLALLSLGALVVANAAEPDAVEKKFWEADQAFTKSEEAAQAEYRKSLAALLASADKAVVYLLDFETKEASARFGWWLDDARGGTLARTNSRFGRTTRLRKS